MNDITREIFNLYYDGKIEKIIDIIKKDNTIDYYYQDQNEKTLLHYLLLLNNSTLVKELLDKNIIFNYLDIKGRSILYNIIKNKYNGILQMIIDKYKNIILTYDRNGLVPIHYSILFNNMEAFKIFVDILKPLHKLSKIRDNKGNDLCNYIIKNNNLYCIDYLKILNYDNYYDNNNNDGYSLLMNILKSSNDKLYDYLITKIHNINFNCQDIIYEDFVLSYFVKYRQQKKLLYLLKNNTITTNFNNNNTTTTIGENNLENTINNKNLNIDFNKQDKKCQTITHILLRDIYINIENASDDLELLRYIINNFDIDFYIYDIKMLQPSHLALKILNYYKTNNDNEKNKLIYKSLLDITKSILQKSDLNFQDLKYLSPLHLICKYDLIDDLQEILLQKFLNLNLIDNTHKKPLDYLNEEQKQNFIKILLQNYTNFINNNKNILNISFSYKDNNDLIKIITEKIKNNDFSFCNNIIKNNYCKFTIPEYLKKTKSNEFYFGSSFDIICGCKYLVNKYKVYFPYNKKVNDNTEFLLSYFNRTNNINTNNDIVFDDNFIIWHSNNLKLYVNDMLISKIQKKILKYDYIIIPLLIYNNETNTNHMNMIIIYKEDENILIYRYDPYGLYYDIKYNFKKLNDELKKSLYEIGNYIDPSNYLIKTGIQILEENDENQYFSDNTGYCIIWCILFCDLLFENKNIKIQKIVKYMISEIFKNNINLKNLIKNYLNNIIIVRNKIINDLNININDYYNNELDITEYYKIIKYKIKDNKKIKK